MTTRRQKGAKTIRNDRPAVMLAYVAGMANTEKNILAQCYVSYVPSAL